MRLRYREWHPDAWASRESLAAAAGHARAPVLVTGCLMFRPASENGSQANTLSLCGAAGVVRMRCASTSSPATAWRARRSGGTRRPATSRSVAAAARGAHRGPTLHRRCSAQRYCARNGIGMSPMVGACDRRPNSTAISRRTPPSGGQTREAWSRSSATRLAFIHEPPGVRGFGPAGQQAGQPVHLR